MKKPVAITLTAILLSTLGTMTAAAQEGRHLDLQSTAEVEREITNDRGEKETVLQPAQKVFPGETVVFSTIYTNIGQEPADDITVTNAVPEHMVYVGGSAQGEGADVVFSVDGGLTYDSPGNLTVVGEDGRQRQASPEEYTHIRWILKVPVNPGDTGSVSFKATVK